MSNNKGINKTDAMHNFLLFMDYTFKKHQIVYWLDAGGLLKAVRDGDLTSSSDLDFGIWQQDIDKVLVLCDDLKTLGFKFIFDRSALHFESEIRVYVPPAFNLDFCCIDILLHIKWKNEACLRGIDNPVKHRKFGIAVYKLLARLNRKNVDQRVDSHYGFLLNLVRSIVYDLIYIYYIKRCFTVWYVIPAHFFENLRPIKIHGLEINCPYPIENYLQYRYGDKWVEHDKQWRLGDGMLIRIRMPSEIPEEHVIKRKVESDTIINNNPKNKSRGIYFFTSDELNKFYSLDSDRKIK